MPRGTVAYIAGMLALFAGFSLCGLFLLYSLALAPRNQPEAPFLVLLSGLLAFGGINLLAAGLYRMLVHLYHTISRTDPSSDRPLRGRTVFLLGQIGSAMTVPTTTVFLFLPALGAPRADLDKIAWGAVPAGFLMMLTSLVFFAGLGYMVQDLFVRHRDIVEKAEAERRRRLDEANELPTELIPVVRPLADLRQHIKEDR